MKKEQIPIGELDKYVPEALVLAVKELLHLPAPKIDARQSVKVTLLQPRRFKDLTPDEQLRQALRHAGRVLAGLGRIP